MSDRFKKIFLALSIIVPFLLYCIYYYAGMIKNAPYKFTEFESLTFKYGLDDSLINQYDSKTGNYQYVNDRDSLVKAHVKISKDDLLYLHRKAADLGFWDFPEQIIPSDKTAKTSKSPRYYLEFKYKRKTKHILFDLNYTDDPKLKDAARVLIEQVNRTINDAEDRGRK